MNLLHEVVEMFFVRLQFFVIDFEIGTRTENSSLNYTGAFQFSEVLHDGGLRKLRYFQRFILNNAATLGDFN